MKKPISILMILSALLLSACACRHNWCEATCTAPKTCYKCGATEGEAIGHIWEEATCTVPKTCARCGATEGEPEGHIWKEATCTSPATCTKCGKKTGTASGKHSRRQGKCDYCGKYINELADEMDVIREAYNNMQSNAQGIRLRNTFYGASADMYGYLRLFNDLSYSFKKIQNVVNKYPDDFSTLIEPLNNLEKQIESTTSRFNSSTTATQKLSVLLEFCEYFNALPNGWAWREFKPVMRVFGWA